MRPPLAFGASLRRSALLSHGLMLTGSVALHASVCWLGLQATARASSLAAAPSEEFTSVELVGSAPEAAAEKPAEPAEPPYAKGGPSSGSRAGTAAARAAPAAGPIPRAAATTTIDVPPRAMTTSTSAEATADAAALVMPPRASSAPSPNARFVLGVVAGGADRTDPPSNGAALGDAQHGPELRRAGAKRVLEAREVAVPARLLAGGAAPYPAAARAAGIERDVLVELVVDEAGRVASAQTPTRAGYGLDEAALRAVRTYRFRPAVAGGRAVPVRMHWVVSFRLT